MNWSRRLRSAAPIAGIHLGLSSVVVLVIAVLVLGVWYPHPYDQMIQGRNLLFLLLALQLACGPLLTLLLFDPDKEKYKWRIDIALIALIQIAALLFSLTQLASSRPIFTAFEGDRFRVVQANDIVVGSLPQSPSSLSKLGYGGPRLIGVRLLEASDPEYPKSVTMAMQGVHPAFRPERWREYNLIVPEISRALRPIAELKAKHPNRVEELMQLENSLGIDEENLGYLPLVRAEITDWVIFIRRADGQPVAYAHIDSW
ncbi:hypothetical protein [Hydrogenophaga sp.]|uniref:hypothetical protein n=1 Tax=Hydrogenophaga sp. TaxID=1904254 RepID=UPI00260D026D|nr:hypothetical protein [Hydrogenophaga sp.]MDM7949042.1 hypothetical protein [Hydrogenophaga sp.]